MALWNGTSEYRIGGLLSSEGGSPEPPIGASGDAPSENDEQIGASGDAPSEKKAERDKTNRRIGDAPSDLMTWFLTATKS